MAIEESGNEKPAFHLRPLLPEDADALAAFYAERSGAVRAFFEPFPDMGPAKALSLLEETEAGKHVMLGLARARDGAIEGNAFVLFVDSPEPVFGIGLLESAQGEGWGRKMTEATLREADARGLPIVFLTVIKENVRAKSLYEKMGFVLCGESTFREANDSWKMQRACPASESDAKLLRR